MMESAEMCCQVSVQSFLKIRIGRLVSSVSLSVKKFVQNI